MLMQVGPESAGAHPGPVCYRKGGYAGRNHSHSLCYDTPPIMALPVSLKANPPLHPGTRICYRRPLYYYPQNSATLGELLEITFPSAMQPSLMPT